MLSASRRQQQLQVNRNNGGGRGTLVPVLGCGAQLAELFSLESASGKVPRDTPVSAWEAQCPTGEKARQGCQAMLNWPDGAES